MDNKQISRELRKIAKHLKTSFDPVTWMIIGIFAGTIGLMNLGEKLDKAKLEEEAKEKAKEAIKETQREAAKEIQKTLGKKQKSISEVVEESAAITGRILEEKLRPIEGIPEKEVAAAAKKEIEKNEQKAIAMTEGKTPEEIKRDLATII